MKKGYVLIKLLVIAAIFAGIFGGYYVMRRNLYIATTTLMPGATGNVNFEVQKLQENGLIPIEITFKTGTPENVENISVIAFKIEFASKSGAVPVLTDQEGREMKSITLSADLTASDEWEFPVNKIESTPGGVILNLSALNKNKKGYSNVNSEKLATIYVKGLSTSEELRLELEDGEMFSKRRPVSDIWTQ